MVKGKRRRIEKCKSWGILSAVLRGDSSISSFRREGARPGGKGRMEAQIPNREDQKELVFIGMDGRRKEGMGRYELGKSLAEDKLIGLVGKKNWGKKGRMGGGGEGGKEKKTKKGKDEGGGRVT